MASGSRHKSELPRPWIRDKRAIHILDNLAELIEAEPELVNKRFSELDCDQTGGRLLLLKGGTLLHVAVEYGNAAAVALLLDRGADVNARATVDEAGGGGQTAILRLAGNAVTG
jgi:hypothetical protein